MYRFIDLNEHSYYVKILNVLERNTKYIEYVLVDEDDVCFIDNLSDDIIQQKYTNKWWGTETSRSCCLYKIKSTPKLFSRLKKFSTFCISKTDERGDYVETTDFGINDIAFFDDRLEPILFTTTHEGYISLRKEIRF
ncbi:MAG: hypothetical protein K2N57_05555 [Clostridia bacterium]|nr:hypothetical protein [Clostridia bacterium]